MTTETEARASSIIATSGVDPLAFSRALDLLRAAGIQLIDTQRGEFKVKWIDVQDRAVPPDADTIIRTITTTVEGVSTSTTHWLEGIQPPPT
jgi:hypothetical protein